MSKLPEQGTPQTDADRVELAAKRAAEKMEDMAHEHPMCAAEFNACASVMYALGTALAEQRHPAPTGVMATSVERTDDET